MTTWWRPLWNMNSQWLPPAIPAWRALQFTILYLFKVKSLIPLIWIVSLWNLQCWLTTTKFSSYQSHVQSTVSENSKQTYFLSSLSLTASILKLRAKPHTCLLCSVKWGKKSHALSSRLFCKQQFPLFKWGGALMYSQTKKNRNGFWHLRWWSYLTDI